MIATTIKFAIATGRLEDRSDEGEEDTEEDGSADEEDAIEVISLKSSMLKVPHH